MLQPLLLDFSESAIPATLIVNSGLSGSKKLYLINMKDENGTCPELPIYPHYVLDFVGTVMDGKLILCLSSSCYYYREGEDNWVRQADLLADRVGASGILLNSSTWWISGGTTSRDVTEIRNTEEISTRYVLNLHERSYHSVIRVNGTHVLLAGGSTSQGEIDLFDITTQSWSFWADVPVPNTDFQTGMILFPDRKRKLVVVGGSDINFSYGLDLDTLEWEPMPALPIQIYKALSVQYDTNFIIVGGKEKGSPSHLLSMYTYDILREEWVELPQRLEVSYTRVSGFFLPDGFLC